MFKTIKSDERGVIYKKGDYAGVLRPGSHFTFGDVDIHKLGSFFYPRVNLEVLLEDKKLEQELFIFEVQDNQVAVFTKNGNFHCAISAPGKYAVWKGPWELNAEIFDISEPYIEDKRLIKWARETYLSEHAFVVSVSPHENAMLYIDRRFVKVAKPGDYYFWRKSKAVQIESVDMRQQQVELSGQELLTKDKITLRINFTATFKVDDPQKAIENSSGCARQLYSEMQLALRDYIGSYSLEEVLSKKDEISKHIIDSTKSNCDEIGISVLRAGMRDVILPGDIKNIIDQVLIAEKQAQANIITRREETASMRNMLNTAKLMEENKMLFRLREMEHIEKIVASVDSIELSSKESMLEQIRIIAGKSE